MEPGLRITPTFVLPYKRYDSETLLGRSRNYLQNDRQTYRSSVRDSNQVIGYQTPPGKPIDERALSPSTIWRSVTWLGSQVAALAVGLRLLLKHDPNSTCHRFVGAVAPHKFRSPQRELKLRQARQLLHLIDDWDRNFDEKFFPRFATRSGVP